MTKPEAASEGEENYQENQEGNPEDDFEENFEDDTEENSGELDDTQEEILELELKKSADDAEKQKLLEENARLKDQVLRALADAENTRRRAKLDIEDAGKYATVSLARDLINVLENFTRAEQNAPAEEVEKSAAFKSFLEAMSMTKRELLGAFEKHGIKRIDPLGEKFDHNLHQAVAQVESADKEPGTVIGVVQAGYVIRDRLLRPAMVAVAKAPEKKEDGEPSVDMEA